MKNEEKSNATHNYPRVVQNNGVQQLDGIHAEGSGFFSKQNSSVHTNCLCLEFALSFTVTQVL